MSVLYGVLHNCYYVTSTFCVTSVKLHSFQHISQSLTADKSSNSSSLTDVIGRGGEGRVSGELMVTVVYHGLTILGMQSSVSSHSQHIVSNTPPSCMYVCT